MDEGGGSYRRLLFIAILIGIVSGFGSLLFFKGLGLATEFFMGLVLAYQYPVEGSTIAELAAWSAPANPWLIVPLICIGGLASALLAHFGAEEIEGAGKDAAIHAFHREGVIRQRVPFLKGLATILVIATGGSAGREGPVAHIAAGLGSIIADFTGLSGKERRIAIVTGIGAGVGAIFKAPLGGAILAVEVLYIRDFESEAVISAFLASVVSYSIFCTFEGFEPIFNLGPIMWNVLQIPLFILLGVVCAGFGLLYSVSFHGARKAMTDAFRRRNIPAILKPVFGAFCSGAIITLLLAVSPEFGTVGLAGMGTGYGFLQLAMFSMLPLTVLILVPFAKIAITSLTIGSGESGGLFGPGIVTGGFAGAAFGTILHLLAPSIVPQASISAFTVVGMIALFGAIANAPLGVMIMGVEMTGDFSLLVPAMGAVAIAQLLTGEHSIFKAQVKNKAYSDAHRGEYEIEVLERIAAQEAMVEAANVVTLTPTDQGGEVLALINTTGHTGFPVMEGAALAGIITIGDIRDLQSREALDQCLGEVMVRDLVTIGPETTLEEALRLMITHDINHLPVVDPEGSAHLAGFLTRSDIMQAYAHRVTAIHEARKRWR
jgi:CIC family chloride channel protein